MASGKVAAEVGWWSPKRCNPSEKSAFSRRLLPFCGFYRRGPLHKRLMRFAFLARMWCIVALTCQWQQCQRSN